MNRLISLYTIPVIIVLILVMYFILLPIFNLPSYDEIFYASISRALMNTGHMYLNVAPQTVNNNEVLIYGPVYFFVSSIVFKIFGFGINQVRMIGFLFVILCAVICVLILKNQKLSPKWINLFLVLFLLDSVVFDSISNGRMESMATFFSLLSFLILLKRCWYAWPMVRL